MAEEKEIILSVNTGQAESRLAQVQRQITDLTKAQKELKKQYDAGKVSAEDYATANEAMAKALSLLKGEFKTLANEATKNVSVNASLGDSYNEISARVVQLQKDYKALTAEQRESAEGKALLDSIAEQKQALKDMDATMGDFQRNVGNYPQGMARTFGAMDEVFAKFGLNLEQLSSQGFASFGSALKSVGGGIKQFGKTLLTSPIGWLLITIQAIVLVFDKLKEGFEKNTKAMGSLKKLMASFQPVLDLIEKGINLIVESIAWVAEKIADVISSFSDASKEAQDAVDKQERAEIRRHNEEAKRLAEERREKRENAQLELDLSDLRAKIADKDKYTAEERLAYMDELIKKEKEVAEQSKTSAEEELRKEQIIDNLDREEDIIELETVVLEKTREYNEKMRALEEERANIAKEIAEKESERRKKAEDAERKRGELEIQIADELAGALLAIEEESHEKRRKVLEQQQAQELEDLAKKYSDEELLTEQAQEDLLALTTAIKRRQQAELDALDAEETARQESILRQRAEAIAQVEDEIYNQRKEAGQVTEDEEREREAEKFSQELEELRTRLQEKGVVEEEIQRLINEKKTAQAEAQAQKEEEIEKQKSIAVANQMATSLNAFGSVLDGVEKLAGAFAKDDEERAKMSKVLAIGKIAVQTGIALAQGIASAQSVPFPANIGAIATTITSVMTGIASAIASVNGAKFATGGIVGGTSYTGDNVPVLVNSGEMILNQGQQARLFELANGYGSSNIEALAGAMAYAVSQQPAPVVVYDEFNAFGAKVAQINEMTTFNL